MELAETVAEWHLANRKKVHDTDLASYARTIKILFSFENEESYFLPRGGEKRNPGGKIYNKINTIKARHRKREKQENEHLKRLKLEPNHDTIEKQIPAKASNAYQWLVENCSPWTTVVEFWTESFCARVSFLTKSAALDSYKKANLWHHVASEHGYQLVRNEHRSSNNITQLFVFSWILTSVYCKLETT